MQPFDARELNVQGLTKMVVDQDRERFDRLSCVYMALTLAGE